MGEIDEDAQREEARQRLERWHKLPPRIDLNDMTTATPSSPPNPPEIGDPNRDFMLRYA